MGNVDESSPVKMSVRALVIDPASKMPVVILQQPEQNAYLPIWIGVCEANSIAVQLEGVATPRPMTHDLLGSIIRTLGHTLDYVLIHSLNDNVFQASIHLTSVEGVRSQVDARPSDAIAIALRAKADVLVDPSVLDRALVTEGSQEKALKTVLENLRPEDLGEYEM